MAVKAAVVPLLAVVFLLAASAAVAEINFDKEEVATIQKYHNAISEQVETEGFKDCLRAVYEGTGCTHDILKASFGGRAYMSKECCHKLFVQIGESCVLAALRFFYPFKDQLTRELKQILEKALPGLKESEK